MQQPVYSEAEATGVNASVPENLTIKVCLSVLRATLSYGLGRVSWAKVFARRGRPHALNMGAYAAGSRTFVASRRTPALL